MNNLTKEKICDRLKKENLASKNVIVDFVNDRVTSNKTRFLEAETKRNDHIISYIKKKYFLSSLINITNKWFIGRS